MALSTQDIVDAIIILAEEKTRTTIIESTKGCLVAGATTFACALLFGLPGILVGSLIGAGLACKVTNDFRSLPNVLKNDLSEEKKKKLVKHLHNIFKETIENLPSIIFYLNASIKKMILIEVLRFLSNAVLSDTDEVVNPAVGKSPKIEHKTDNPAVDKSPKIEGETGNPAVGKSPKIEHKTDNPAVDKAPKIEGETGNPAVGKSPKIEHKTDNPVVSESPRIRYEVVNPAVGKSPKIEDETDNPAVSESPRIRYEAILPEGGVHGQ